MLNKLLGAALAVSLVAGIAYAANDQMTPPPPGDQGEMGQGPNGGQGGWWGKRHHGGRGQMRGAMGQDGPGMMPPPAMGMMGAKGFRLQLGPNVSVGLMCGQQSMKDCIAEAQPLIDAAKAAVPAK